MAVHRLIDNNYKLPGSERVVSSLHIYDLNYLQLSLSLFLSDWLKGKGVEDEGLGPFQSVIDFSSLRDRYS